MDSFNKRGIIFTMFSSLLLLAIVFKHTECQLTNTDLSYIKKTILSSQDEATGLFAKSVHNTYQAIYSLKTLNEVISFAPKICREINYEAMNGLSIEIVQINEMLNCNQNFNPALELKDEEMMNVSLDVLYKRVNLAQMTKAKVNWGLVYDNLKPFITSENLFTDVNGSTSPSLLSTAYGLKLLSLIHQNVESEIKSSLDEAIILIVKKLQTVFQLIRDDIGLFTEENVPSLKLNSEFAEALYLVNNIINIENFEELLLKILNYLVTFKYDYVGLDNIYYLIKGTLSNLPIIQSEKKVYDYVDDKTLTLKLLNGFGREIKDYSVTFTYKLKASKEADDKKNKKGGEFDLDEEESGAITEVPSLKTEITSTSIVSLDLTTLIKSPGKFTLDVKAGFINLTTKKAFDQVFEIGVNSISKIKLNHLKMSVTNTQEKTDEKEITVEYPKRTFKNFKATQNSVISLKVKLNFVDSQVNKIEQIFLRLRHTEIGKSYSAYVSQYKAVEDYSIINFDLSDTSYMEAYDGLYELTLIVSDIALDNPMIWNFGKLEVKFKRPLDPTNFSPSYKNVQKEKMEPSFPVEESPNKNIISSLIFSAITCGLFAYFLIYLKINKANMARFPKASNISSFLFSLAFVVLVLLITYVFVLFFIKLNIIQTLITLIVLGVPGALIVYKTLSKITIEV